jgi:hypothetical protein
MDGATSRHRETSHIWLQFETAHHALTDHGSDLGGKKSSPSRIAGQDASSQMAF